ncbi:M20/M25/M40 family metallo-hydrolase [Polluticaenibacter yanchengensis]|uniref:Carboxypeptidase Q n=1 Tax=Polluticaenibacter yanchengensis TaxID=3014562 RepID=A0ABT4UP72_9BACT|nr:M20/M25/M40 family metallo-hydrolase [Chitinophagaceae bacterium LY-5]
MKKLAFLLLLVSNLGHAQSKDETNAKVIGNTILQKSIAYENLRYLCKNIGNRLSGSKNYDKAVEATAKMLKIAGADTVYLEECKVPKWERGAKEEAFVYINGVKGKSLNVCALGMSFATPEKGLKAEVIEVKNFDELRALGASKIQGKIVFFNYPMKPELVTGAYGDAAAYRGRGPIEAAKLGAVGVITRSLTHAQDDIPHTGTTRKPDAGIPEIPAMAISTNDADYLSKLLTEQKNIKTGKLTIPDRLRPKNALDMPVLAKAQKAEIANVAFSKDVQLTEIATDNKPVNETKATGTTPSRQTTAAGQSKPLNNNSSYTAPEPQTIEIFMKQNCKHYDDVVAHNVIAEIRGSEFPNEIIVAGGHLDSWDLGEGAHDDGTGVVQAIDVIRTLNLAGLKPKRTIRVVLFANEENGLRGGTQFAENARLKNEKIIFAIESDGGGYGCAAIGVTGTPEQQAKIKQWQPLFYPFGIYDINYDGGGADINPLKESGTVISGIEPNSQRYFDLHHTKNDVFEAVNKRELELGAIGMTLMCWLISEHGI